MVWTAANGVRQTTKLSTRTSAFLAAFLLAISSLATTVSPFIEQAFAVSPLNGDSASLTVNNDSYSKTVDTSALSSVKLTFDYDATSLDSTDDVVLAYSAGSASGAVNIDGQTNPQDSEKGSVTLNKVPSQANLPVTISADTSGFSGPSSDSIELTNITVSGTENKVTIGSTTPSDNETISGAVQLDVVLDNYDVSEDAHVYVYPSGSDTSVFDSNMTNKGGNHWQDDQALDTTKLDDGSYDVKFVVPQGNGNNVEKTVTVTVDNSSALSAPTDATQTAVTKVTKLTNPKYPYYELSYANFNVDDATEILQQAGDKVIKLALVQNDTDDYVWIDGHKYGSDNVNVYYKVNGNWKVTNLVYDANGNLYTVNGVVIDGYVDSVPPEGNITSIGGKAYTASGTVTRLTGGKLQVTGTVSDNLAMNRVGVQLVKPGVSGDIQYVYANGNHMYGQTGQLNWTAEFNNAQVASLENGTYGINLYYVDKAGNVATQKVTFTLDNTRPLVKFTQAPSSFVNGDFDVSATFTDANGLDPSSLVLQVEDLGANSRAAKCLGGHPHVTVVSSTQVTLSCTIDTSMLQDGYTKYVVWAWGKDVAGNSTSNVQSSTNQSQVPFVVDRQAPSTPTLVSPVNRDYEKTNDFYFEWNDSSDASPVTYEFQSSLNPHTSNGVLDSGVWNSLANGQTLTDSSIHSTGAPDGAWYWQVRAIDAAGNKSDWTPVWKVTLDTSAPETTLVAPIGLTDGTFTVSGHATDNLSLNRVYVQLVSRVTNQRCGGTTINLIGQGTSADWLKNYDLSTLGAGCPDGQYAAHVTVVDMAGNVSSQGWTPDFTVDSTRPTSVRIDAPADGYLQSGTFTISGTAGDNPGGSGIDHVNVYVSKVTAPDENGKTFGGYVVDNQPAQQFDPATGVFSYDVSGLADGQYKIKAVAYDRANNYHFANTLELTVDSLAPSVTINTYSGTNTAPKLTGTVDDPMAKVFVTIDGNTYRAINNQDNTWGLSLVNPLSLGNHQASAVATDLADNTTPVAALTTLVVSKVFLPSIASTHREQKSQDTSGGNTTNNSGTARGSNSYTPLFATASAAPAGAVLGDSTTTSNDPANTDDQGQVKADETTNADPAANTGDPLNQCTKFFGLCWYWYIPIVIVVIAILYWLFKPRHDNKPA